MTYISAGWSQSHQRRLENRDFLVQRITEQQETIEDVQRISVGLMAANAIIIGSWQYEKLRAEQNEQSMHRANGRLGPMQRKINELERSIDLIRDDWTAEVGVQ
ncbi:hypothetical protein ACUN7Z_00565 [Vreelandella venusta]|uniref:hypothetical protein n=1 Tax=Vreelandella venusta TaxID=44935 RepID=UPI004043EE7E